MYNNNSQQGNIRTIFSRKCALVLGSLLSLQGRTCTQSIICSIYNILYYYIFYSNFRLLFTNNKTMYLFLTIYLSDRILFSVDRLDSVQIYTYYLCIALSHLFIQFLVRSSHHNIHFPRAVLIGRHIFRVFPSPVRIIIIISSLINVHAGQSNGCQIPPVTLYSSIPSYTQVYV